jgi:hypothetical protein
VARVAGGVVSGISGAWSSALVGGRLGLRVLLHGVGADAALRLGSWRRLPGLPDGSARPGSERSRLFIAIAAVGVVSR